MTFVLDGLRRSGKLLLRSVLTKRGSVHALQALFPPVAETSPRAGTSSEVLCPEASSSSLPSGGQAKKGGGGLGVHLVLRLVRLPLLPLDLGPARWKCLWSLVGCERVCSCLFCSFRN